MNQNKNYIILLTHHDLGASSLDSDGVPLVSHIFNVRSSLQYFIIQTLFLEQMTNKLKKEKLRQVPASDHFIPTFIER